MSKDEILLVRFEKSPNTEIWLLLLVEKSGFAFMALTSNRVEAEYLKDHIQDIGAKEYNRHLKSAGISKKLQIKNFMKEMKISNTLDMPNIDDEDDDFEF